MELTRLSPAAGGSFAQATDPGAQTASPNGRGVLISSGGPISPLDRATPVPSAAIPGSVLASGAIPARVVGAGTLLASSISRDNNGRGDEETPAAAPETGDPGVATGERLSAPGDKPTWLDNGDANGTRVGCAGGATGTGRSGEGLFEIP